MVGVIAILSAALLTGGTDTLEVTMVGNAGVTLSDGVTTLMVDLPYEPGASGYMMYEPEDLAPRGTVVAVVTHHHRDHFSPALFKAGRGWKLVGPPSVTRRVAGEGLLEGDSVAVGAFSIVAIPTPHTPDHRSYRVRWGDRLFLFVGDTESPEFLAAQPRLDILFITPWLSCVAHRAGTPIRARRLIAYHVAPGGTDTLCGPVEVIPQGASFTVGRPGR